MGNPNEFYDDSLELQKSGHRRKSSHRSRRSRSRRSDLKDDTNRRSAISETSVQVSAPDWPFKIDFALKTLAFAVAVTFGIWTPFSFYVSSKWNEQDDAFQASLLSLVSGIAANMSKATATAQQDGASSPVLWSLDTRLRNLERLQALQYCDGKAERFVVCRQLTASLDYGSVVSDVASFSTSQAVVVETQTAIVDTSITLTSSTASLVPSQTITSVSEASGMGYPPLPDIMEWRQRPLGKEVALACGMIFIGILVCGLIVYWWCIRRPRWMRNEKV